MVAMVMGSPMHLSLLASLANSSSMKYLTTRCSLYFRTMHGLNCERACLLVGKVLPSASIAVLTCGVITGLAYTLIMQVIWIVGS